MKHRIFKHWQAKAASLLVAVAVWYLLKGHVGNQQRPRIVSDPGAPIASAGLTSDGIFGPGRDVVSSSAQVAAERPQASLTRLHWVDVGTFSAGVVEFPSYPCA